MDEIRMKDCPDCGGIGDFDESECCGYSIGGDGYCNLCHNPAARIKCVRCSGTGEVPDEDYDQFEHDTDEADSNYSQDLLDEHDL